MSAIRDEIEAARSQCRQHRRLRFNMAAVARFLDLGDMPAQIVDVNGLCDRLGLKREAIEELVAIGLPHADINPRAIRKRQEQAQ